MRFKASGPAAAGSWLWQDKNYIPNPRDIIFLDWDDPDGYSGPQDGVPDHVGIVEKIEKGWVYTIRR